jgi:hypothetical protein
MDEDALINRLHTFFRAHEKIPCVIRQADSTSSSNRVRLGRALAVLREFSNQTTGTSLDDEGDSPHIEFRAGTGAVLQVYPGENDAAALVLFSEPYHLWASSEAYIGRWTRQQVSRSDQEALLTAFFQREYTVVKQSLEPMPQPLEEDEDHGGDTSLRWDDEGGSVSREKYWAQIKQHRATRGEAPDLSIAEKELSPEDCLELCGREERLSHEYQHGQTLLRGHKIGRLLGSVAALVGLIAITLQYLDYLPEKLLGLSRAEQRGHYLTLIVLGGIFALISHLDLRALLLGTPRAAKQAQIAKWIVGGVVLVVTLAMVALALALFWSELTNSGVLPAVAGVALAMLLAFLGVFYFQYRYKEVEIKQAIAAAASMGLTPFGVAAFGVFQLFLTTMLIALIAMAIGAPGLEAWIRNNIVAVMIVIAVIMMAALGVKYIHGRYRARSWEGRLTTLWTGAIFVVIAFPIVTVGVLLVLAALRAVKTLVLG